MTATAQGLGPHLCLLYVPVVRGIALECDMGGVRRFNHGLTDGEHGHSMSGKGSNIYQCLYLKHIIAVLSQ